ncbi:MAG: hypothetical protein H0Z28_11065 [Archaeoglobus sp.]|nr:hypothetical protein [Archaeoglobus sp.]
MNKTLQGELYQTAYSSRKSIEQIADETGISPMYLYKMLSGGCNFPLYKLIPFMNACNDYRVLRHIAHRTGHLLVKIPRVGKSKKDDIEMVKDYQDKASRVIRMLLEYIKNPSEGKKQNIIEALNCMAEESIRIKKRIEKNYQLELEY